MRARLFIAISMAVMAAGLLLACTDPGCIRNSECGNGFECRASQCVAQSTDAAARAGDDLDGSTK
jgi:hypothetical protein